MFFHSLAHEMRSDVHRPNVRADCHQQQCISASSNSTRVRAAGETGKPSTSLFFC